MTSGYIRTYVTLENGLVVKGGFPVSDTARQLETLLDEAYRARMGIVSLEVESVLGSLERAAQEA
jgi:hypothetical protein